MSEILFDKKKCLSAIYAIAKEKNIKIGDLEKNANVSAGYLSKLNKEDNTALPSIELLLSISKMLEVTLDMMMNVDYGGLTKNEKYVVSFIDKLIRDTLSGELYWKKESKKYLSKTSYSICNNEYSADHPLYDVREEYRTGPSGYQEESYAVVYYNSRFFEDGTTTVTGDCFITVLSSDSKLYVMKVDNDEAEFNDEGCFFELYIVSDTNGVLPLCCTQSVCRDLSRLISSLYHTIVEVNSNLNINAEIKNVIDVYMVNMPF